MFYWFSYYVIKVLGAIFSPRTVLGREHVPSEGSYIVASNHVSYLDPFLIGLSLERRISYMAKDTLFHNIILRIMLKWVEAFPVRRESSDIGALREALRRLMRGLPIVLFPEGTRKTAGSETKTQSGIGFLAVKGGIPIVPVYIKGSDKVLPRGARFPKRSRILVKFGKPLSFTKEQSYPDIVTCIMNEIQALANHF